MTPQLKVVSCSEIEDLESWIPADEDVCFWLQLSIGLEDGEAADNFQVCVATPAGLRSDLGRLRRPRGAGSVRPIVMQSYSWAALLAAIRERLESCGGSDWFEVQEKLRHQFEWEYERRESPLPVRPTPARS